MVTNEYKKLLEAFLKRWTIENIERMTLEEYVSLNNSDTFCQWFETRTKILGSIKGGTAIKFGIYKRKEPTKRPQFYKNDTYYSWLPRFGENRDVAYRNIKREILTIIELTKSEKYHLIDELLLPDLYKWKIAFLYSSEKLIPIYKRELLFQIAHHFGFSTTAAQTKVSEIQHVMMLNKPVQLSVFKFMELLDNRFNN